MNEASNEIILRKDEIFATGSKTYITAKQVASLIYKNEPNTGQKATIRASMEKMFGDCRVPSNPSNYRVMDCWIKATEMSNDISASDVDGGEMDSLAGGVASDLPF